MMASANMERPNLPVDAPAENGDGQKVDSTKPVVLLAWEYGRNFGHVSRLLAIARLLEEHGARPQWVVPPAYAQSSHILDAGYKPFCSPQMRVARPAAVSPTNSFADILVSFGFADGHVLTEAVESWINLFRQIKPHSIVLDYAPAAQLAAHLVGIPAFQITNGFDAPPSNCPVFNIAMRGPYLDRLNAQKVAGIDVAIQLVSERLIKKEYSLPMARATLQSMLNYPVKILDVIPELDIYAPRDIKNIYVGPLVGLSYEIDGAWSDIKATSSVRRIFAYLRNVSGTQKIIMDLARSGYLVLCVCPDAPDSWLEESHKTMRIQREPVNWNLAIEGADAVINYGALTSICRTLLAGKPQVMVPIDMEKHLACKRVAEIGAGLILHDSTRIKVESLLDQFFETEKFQKSALKIAQRYSDKYFDEERGCFMSLVMQE